MALRRPPVLRWVHTRGYTLLKQSRGACDEVLGGLAEGGWMRRLLTVIGVLVALPGCSTPTELDHRRVIGVIEFAGAIATIVAPDTVQVSNSFTATVNSLGSSSCTTPDGVELTLTPSEARVTPYDLVPEADSRAVCKIGRAHV